MNDIIITRKAINKEISRLYEILNELQEKCLHPDLKSEQGGDRGNYDRSQDCYWVDYSCEDCGKRWRKYK